MVTYKDKSGVYRGSTVPIGAVEITETEYSAIISVIRNRPTAPDGYGYRLREDLTWELYELPPAPDPEDEDISGDELLDALEAIL